MYSTARIAALIGVHPNTVRFYERMELLPPVPRSPNGYRIFDARHVAQLQLLRTAFRADVTGGRLRQEAVGIVKAAASGDTAGAIRDTAGYLSHLRSERSRAVEAIRIAQSLLADDPDSDADGNRCSGRDAAAFRLGISTDVLRDWERNGLVRVPRDGAGRLLYTGREFKRLKIIRTLRNANYSTQSILRMLNRLDRGDTDLRAGIDTPGDQEDIIRAADRYITALSRAESDALEMLRMLGAAPDPPV